MTSRSAPGKRSGTISKWKKCPGCQRSKKNSKIARLTCTLRLNVRSTNLNCRAPRSSNRCNWPSNTGSGARRTGISSDDKQNSHVNGHPRDAST